MRLPDFELFEPTTVAAACALLSEDPCGSAVIAGGTDVLVDLKERNRRSRRLVSLRRIGELHEISFDPRTGLSVGAMATVNQVAEHVAIAEHYPGIVDAALSLAADQVRNQATVCGNLCMAVPSADMAPVLLALTARLRIAGGGGERLVALREFFLGPRQTVLAPGEIVVAIEVEAPRSGTGSASLRQGGRASLSLPLVSAAAALIMDGQTCAAATIALGAVAPTPMVTHEASRMLDGKRISTELLLQVGEAAAAEARPIDDHRAPRSYRLELVKVLTRRAVERAVERAGR